MNNLKIYNLSRGLLLNANVYLIVYNEHGVLVDAPLSRDVAKTLQAICEIGVDLAKVTHIVITHAHFDHCSGLSAIGKEHTNNWYHTWV